MSIPILAVDGLTVTRDGRDVLQRLELAVHPGDRVAVTGANGVGKTTLLDAIAGTVSVTSGRISLDGRDITAIASHRRARLGIARTWQHPAVCHNLTVADNLALATRTTADIRKALHATGLTGLDQQQAHSLSYGQQRRLEIAIALAARPRLLLLDEPTAGLAGPDITRLIAILTDSSPNTAILVADHHDAFLNALATRRLELTGGGTLHTGPPHPPPATADRCPLPTSSAGVPALQVNLPANRHHPAAELHVAAGQILWLTGPNGSGKTTRLETAAGIRATPGATVTLHGRRIEHLSSAARHRAGITLLPQTRRLFGPLTVADNLALTGADLTWIVAHLPALQPLLPRRAETLSGGQQQLAALARALARPAAVLLLDEPFEGLDHHTAQAALLAITARADQQTAIVIAHHHGRTREPEIAGKNLLAPGTK
ncbi:ATP-binding cassette domain-containing protein [Catellatospora citrea]|uniref:ATP-binding cassette domain-containing protein n=1 Tax=Catellatospora citrea TaxID=53366 RepID=UPI00340E8DA2